MARKKKIVENDWIIQWRYDGASGYDRKHGAVFFASRRTQWNNLKVRSEPRSLVGDKNGGTVAIRWLYAARSKADASRHTLEEAFALHQGMSHTWKNPGLEPYYARPRLWRFYNIETKEEIYPALLGA